MYKGQVSNTKIARKIKKIIGLKGSGKGPKKGSKKSIFSNLKI